ncbi:hypothetical protein H2248_002448 [Termitomyces sp. 'cryptogamus']|nr:hypothetical protein H2248_002448 [Termitomyces sp. 'cryptogamus']
MNIMYFTFENTSGIWEEKEVEAGKLLSSWISSLKEDGHVKLSINILLSARKVFAAERISDEQTLTTIQSFFNGVVLYIVDPSSLSDPAKFSKAVSQALKDYNHFNFDHGILLQEFHGLLEKEKHVIDIKCPDVDLVNVVLIKAVMEKTVSHHAGKLASSGSV